MQMNSDALWLLPMAVEKVQPFYHIYTRTATNYCFAMG